VFGKRTRKNLDAHHGTEPRQPAPDEAVEVLIRRDGSALVNGAPFPVPDGEPVHVAVLDAMHRGAQARGEPVQAAILDRQEGYVTRVEVAPDGSSRILQHERQEEQYEPEPGPAAGPLLAELPPDEPLAGSPSVAGAGLPSDPRPSPAESRPAVEPFPAGPLSAEPPLFEGPLAGPPSAAGDGLSPAPEPVPAGPSLVERSLADSPSAAGVGLSPAPEEPIPSELPWVERSLADLPSAPEPVPAGPSSAEPPFAEPPWATGPSPAGLPPSDADTRVPAVPDQLSELVAQITRAMDTGSLERAVALAFRLREHTARSFGAEHPCTLEACALEAFAAYRSGNHRLAAATSLKLARTRHELGDPRAHDELTRAVVAWRLIDDIPSAVDHGRALLAVWSVLAERGVRSARDETLMRGVNRRMHALAAAATARQTGAA
jgi:hypothetical protein